MACARDAELLTQAGVSIAGFLLAPLRAAESVAQQKNELNNNHKEQKK